MTAVSESLKNSVRDIFSGITSAPYRLGKTAKRRAGHKLQQKDSKKNKQINQSIDSQTEKQDSQNILTKLSKKKAWKQSLTPVPGVELLNKRNTSLI